MFQLFLYLSLKNNLRLLYHYFESCLVKKKKENSIKKYPHIISFYSVNICYNVFITYIFKNRHLHTKLSNEFLSIYTHQDLLPMFHSFLCSFC